MRTRARAERAADLLAAAEDRLNGCATLAVPESGSAGRAGAGAAFEGCLTKPGGRSEGPWLLGGL